MRTSQALHDFTLRSYIKNSTHVNSDQKKTHAKNYITMSNGFFYEIHDNGKAPSLAFHCHGHLTSRPAADLLHDDGKAQSWALHGHGHLISRPAADLLHS